MTQTVLPFPEWRVPGWVLWCFRIANASGSQWTRLLFYEFKNNFLDRHGVPDGWDLQVLDKQCWTCGGTGKFAGWDDCWDCGATGIYRRVRVVLWRYRLGGDVYHCPDFTGPDGWLDLTEQMNFPRETIEHLIEHRRPNWWIGVAAGLALFIRYDRPKALELVRHVNREGYQHIIPTWWVRRVWWPLRSKWAQLVDWVKFHGEDVPF